jgi:O-acetyl-ADP-ribose deacetylase (regulator of RNase III)
MPNTSPKIVLTALDHALAAAWERFCGDLPGVTVHRGSILDVECDAVVSPANSFGFMDGGLDALYARRFGPSVAQRVRATIRERHHGELLVGAADIVPTDDSRIPYLILAPTMRVPMVLTDSVNPYLAARAVFLLIKHGEFGGQPVRDFVKTVVLPGLGTGVGKVGPASCAHQVASAIRDILLGEYTPPRSWAEASERHQRLYTDRLKRLQW